VDRSLTNDSGSRRPHYHSKDLKLNITTTINSVKDEIREWKDFKIVEGSFENSDWSILVKSEERAKQYQQELKALVGQEKEYEIEDTGREYRGRAQVKLKSWPGKPERPQFGGGGGGQRGGGSWQPRFRDTEEGFAREQRSIHRSVALEWAVAFYKQTQEMVPEKQAGQKHVENLLSVAQELFNWLNQDTAQQPTHNATPNKGPAGVPGITTGDKILPPYEHYVQEIDTAIKGKDQARLEALSKMVIGSVDKGSVTLDQADELDQKLQKGKKIIASGVLYAAWIKEKQEEARKREPLSKADQQMEEIRERF
jgi:hypothetical protein